MDSLVEGIEVESDVTFVASKVAPEIYIQSTLIDVMLTVKQALSNGISCDIFQGSAP